MAVVAAGLFLASGFANLHHFLPFTHATCAEHGEAVHAQPLAAGARGVVGARGNAAVHSAPAPSGLAGHEHCSLAAAAHARVATDPPSHVTPAPAPDHIIGIAVEPAVRPAATPTFRIAPKQSPPA